MAARSRVPATRHIRTGGGRWPRPGAGRRGGGRLLRGGVGRSFRGDGRVLELDGAENILKTTEPHTCKWASLMVCELLLIIKTRKEGKNPASEGSLSGPPRRGSPVCGCLACS